LLRAEPRRVVAGVEGPERGRQRDDPSGERAHRGARLVVAHDVRHQVDAAREVEEVDAPVRTDLTITRFGRVMPGVRLRFEARGRAMSSG
jgi:hypothetical protein